ncbi:hypothetical protein [Stenomitos frigidus]|uniref:Uncharacterized protein n=1 Tax=Stenomitos frigidus ULC18 TaxID=2107698 RepID=A0A2T1E094_9CYAN|nr:hypothetical protein [Stenomitos frigidus]PSB26139.1 hypothetical protein C7B82_20665 [Stenomitos frigidus ULC18]
MGSVSTYEFIGGKTPGFQPCQIVCLQHETSYLYAEVVQVVESRHLCWVRPLILTLRSAETLTWDSTLLERSDCYDLRQDSDLLLPLTLFRAALDTEVLPLMANLYADDSVRPEQESLRSRGHQLFRQFIQQVWQAHAEIFQNRSEFQNRSDEKKA